MCSHLLHNLVESDVCGNLWSKDILESAVSRRSARTDEDGLLLSSIVNVVGSEVLLEVLSE